MINLKNRYVIGTHVMFFEIEMYKDFIKGLVNLLEDVENKDNVTIDLCFNLSEQIEKIDDTKISIDGYNGLLEKFNSGVDKINQMLSNLYTLGNNMALEKFVFTNNLNDSNPTSVFYISLYFLNPEPG